MKFPTLAEIGFALNDHVTVSINDDSTGGVIYKIVEVCDPLEGFVGEKEGTRKESFWNSKTCKYEVREVNCMISGAWDKDGKKVLVVAKRGYIRLAPVFYFFPTSLGADPKGKKGTLMLTHDNVIELKRFDRIKKITIVELTTKHAELTDFIARFASAAGAELE